jgi:hypothetical protein
LAFNASSSNSAIALLFEGIVGSCNNLSGMHSYNMNRDERKKLTDTIFASGKFAKIMKSSNM